MTRPPRFIRTVHRFGYAFREVPPMRQRRPGLGPRHNLPVPLTNFIGREREIAELLRLVPSTRLLTLTGAGGCGKTRLALELAARARSFPDGAWVSICACPIQLVTRPWHRCSSSRGTEPADPEALSTTCAIGRCSCPRQLRAPHYDDAVRLFVERASAVDPAFALTAQRRHGRPGV